MMSRCRVRRQLVLVMLVSVMMASCRATDADATTDFTQHDYYRDNSQSGHGVKSTSDDDVSSTSSRDQVKTSLRYDDDDVPGVDDDDAKSLDDNDDYYTYDDDTQDDDHEYDDDNDDVDSKYSSRPDSRSYPEPDHYPEQEYHEPQYYYQPKKKKKKKKVYVPVFVPEKEKKKMKIISVDKGFYIPGGTQLFGKFKSLKHCMKACAVTPSCLAGDFNPWLHKCYQHSNLTACNSQNSHPQFVHFSKVPCTVIDAPAGRVTLGANMANGIEQKGIDTLQQCIKKCAAAGLGIPATATTLASFNTQACFAIDYDFATHRCYFFGSNLAIDPAGNLYVLHCITNAMAAIPSSLGTRPNSNVVHITLCPLPTGGPP